ncbi:MAG: hypothetical protein QXZ14_12065 [Candidatus Jordarchaeales archaeon]
MSLAVLATGLGLNAAIKALNAMLPKSPTMLPQPLQVSIKSETRTFTIATTLGATSGKIAAIRVQDISRNKWFNWDMTTGSWDTSPSCAPGNNLYIAFWAINQGADGNLRLRIIDDTGKVLADKTVYAPYWGGDINKGVGVETGTINMPSRNYGITLEVTP